MNTSKALRLIYTGNVQGVGFRFTVERVAKLFDIKGFVRNLPDGRVEVVCEGEDGNLENFIEKVGEQMDYYIEDCDIKGINPAEKFSGFDIRF